MVRFNTIDPCSIVEEQQLLLNPTVLRLETAAAGKLVCPRTGSVAGAAISMAWPEFVSSGIELGIFWNLWVRFAKRIVVLTCLANQINIVSKEQAILPGFRSQYPAWEALREATSVYERVSPAASSWIEASPYRKRTIISVPILAALGGGTELEVPKKRHYKRSDEKMRVTCDA
jgi:hypothetical protein